MKTKRVLSGILAFLMLTCCSLTTFAHSGKKDSRGGHRDNKNKSGLGSYHYHCGGYPAHLHTNGICPYKTNTTYNNSATTSNSTKKNSTSGTSNSTWRKDYSSADSPIGENDYLSNTKTEETCVSNSQAQSDSQQEAGVIGAVVKTDIKAYINGAEIPAYNFKGNMIIIGTDLRSYGFDVVYDNYSRTSSVSLATEGGMWNPIVITSDTLEIGTEIMNIYETDIKVLVNGTPVTGYNVEGRMAFRFSELAVFGSYYYDNDNRTSNLWIR